MRRGGTGFRPEDSVDATSFRNDGAEDLERELRIALPEAEQRGSECFELAEGEVVADDPGEHGDLLLPGGIHRRQKQGERGRSDWFFHGERSGGRNAAGIGN